MIGQWYTVVAKGPNGTYGPSAHDPSSGPGVGPLTTGYPFSRGELPFLVKGAPVLPTVNGFRYDDQGRVLFNNASDRQLDFLLSQGSPWSPMNTYDLGFFRLGGCVPLNSIPLPNVPEWVETHALGITDANRPCDELGCTWDYDTTYSYTACALRTGNRQWGGCEPYFQNDWTGDNGGGEGPLNGCVDFTTTSKSQQEKEDCGNGTRDPGEECDSSAGDSDCTSDCKKQPNVVHCGDVVQSTGGPVAPPPQVIDLGMTEGEIWFAFDTVDIPDRITVLRGGLEIASTGLATGGALSCDGAPGCVGAVGGMPVTLLPGPSEVTVIVEPNCCGSVNETRWSYLVQCVGTGMPSSAGPE